MLKRIITGTVIMAVTVFLLFFSDTFFYPLAWAILGAVGVYEFLRVFELHKEPEYIIPSVIEALAMPFLGFYTGRGRPSLGIFIAIAMLGLYLMYLVILTVLHHDKIKFSQMASVYFGCSYVFVSFSAMTLISCTRETYAALLILPVFIGSWVTDTMAFFSGTLFGRHKLIPSVSPKKTVEGSIGGTVGCILAFVIYGIVIRNTTELRPNFVMLCLCGLILSILSQFGDLFMSVIKREHNVKDFGSLFPGHGGVLDRFDSVFPIAPVMLYFAMLTGNLALFG